MAISGVKRKFPVAIALAGLGLFTALITWAVPIPPRWVECLYSRRVFPTISHIGGTIADSIPFAWLDVWFVAGALVLVYSLVRRNWQLPLGIASVLYLIFFWGWGLNYHRLPIETRLGMESIPRPTADEFSEFSAATTMAVNRHWPVANREDSGRGSPEAIAGEASRRVRQVILEIDGLNWQAATRVKHSYLADVWFHAAGIDGIFNPLPHEPLLAGGIPVVELPFLTAHELAHAYGIADEGDANFIAFLATIGSDDPLFQYSGAFETWIRLGGSADMLDPGPRRDLKVVFDRIQSQEIPLIRNFQTTLLDSHLKANGVQSGVKSYSRYIALAIATRSSWGNFQ